jgi:hypothetical protein
MAVLLGATALVGSSAVSSATSTKAVFCKAAASFPVTHDISTGSVPQNKASLASVKADVVINKAVQSELVIMVSTALNAKIKGALKTARTDSSKLLAALSYVVSGDEEIASGVYPQGGSKTSAEARIKLGTRGASGEVSLLIMAMSNTGSSLAKVCPALRVYQQ